MQSSIPGWHSDPVIDLVRRVVAVSPEARVSRPYQLLKSSTAFRIETWIPVEDGRNLREGARTTELLDVLPPHEVVSRHPQPGRERRETVDVGPPTLREASERGGANT